MKHPGLSQLAVVQASRAVLNDGTEGKLMGMGRLAAKVGLGLVAGLVGTAAITAVQMVQQRITQAEEEPIPARAVENLLHLRPESATDEQRLAMLAHWGYGTAWGVFRALLDALGVRGKTATTLHTLAIQAAAMVMLPGLKVAPPLREWSAKMVTGETGLHAIYAAAAGLTYDFLNRDVTPVPARTPLWATLATAFLGRRAAPEGLASGLLGGRSSLGDLATSLMAGRSPLAELAATLLGQRQSFGQRAASWARRQAA